MSFSKIYDLRGTNVRKDLQFMTTSSRIKWFEILNFGGDLIFALFRCHSVVRKQPMCLTTHRETDRKFNELLKNI